MEKLMNKQKKKDKRREDTGNSNMHENDEEQIKREVNNSRAKN